MVDASNPFERIYKNHLDDPIMNVTNFLAEQDETKNFDLSFIPILIAAIGSAIVFTLVVVAMITVKERKKAAAAAATSTTPSRIPLQPMRSSLTPTSTTPRFNYELFDETNAENLTPRRPAKRARIEPKDYVEMIKDLFIVLQDESKEVTLMDVTDKDGFANCEMTVIQRANLNVGDEVNYMSAEDVPTVGSVMFIGTKSDCTQFLADVNQPQQEEGRGGEDHPGENNYNEDLRGELEATNHKIEQLEKAISENASRIVLLAQRMTAVESKKSSAPPKPPKPTSALQTLHNNIPTVISSIPNWMSVIQNKILLFQAQSNPIMFNEADIRPQLYQYRNFFLSHYSKPNECGLALLYILVGPELANSCFLPLVFYDIGPSSRSGLLKTSFSYAATNIWYRSMDLLITNVFIPTHRHLFIAKARDFVNTNVNTRKKYPGRNQKHFKDLTLNHPIFTEEEATITDFAAEKERVRGTPEAQVVIAWANSLGLDEEPDTDNDFEDADINGV